MRHPTQKSAVALAMHLAATMFVALALPSSWATDPIGNVCAKADASTLDANKRLVESFYNDVFKGHDFDAAAKYLSEDYHQFSENSVGQGRAEFISTFKKMWSDASEAQRGAYSLTILALVADSDRVVIHTRYTIGKRDGTKLTGTEFDMFQVKDGRIVGHWGIEAARPIKQAD